MVFDELHSDAEARFPIHRPHQNAALYVVWTKGDTDIIRINSTRDPALPRLPKELLMTIDDIAELSDTDFESAIPSRLRKCLTPRKFEFGEDIAAPPRFVRLTQEQSSHKPWT